MDRVGDPIESRTRIVRVRGGSPGQLEDGAVTVSIQDMQSRIFGMYDLLDEKAFPLGTVRTWNGKQFKKMGPGDWEYVGDGRRPMSAPPEQSRGPKPFKKPARFARAAAASAAAARPPKKGIKTLAKKAWGTLVEPFVGLYHLATSKEARKKFKEHIGGAIKKEAKETKELFGTIRKALTPGQKVTKEERTKAINQAVDLAKVALIGTFYGGIAAQGIAELLATVASPAEEVLGALLDKPLRRATKKIFGHEHGILPSSFYGGEEKKEEGLVRARGSLVEIFGKKKPDNKAGEVVQKLMDAIFDELKNESLSPEDLEAAMSKLGVDHAKASKLAADLKKALSK